MPRKLRIVFGVLILVISIVLLIWGFAPLRRETRRQNISPSEMQLQVEDTISLVIPERRLLTLEIPPEIRAGDSDIVRLTLQIDESGNITPTAEIGGAVIQGDVIEIPNLYETHHIIAETSFDIAGLQVSPPDLSSQTLFPGQTVRFFWSIRPNEVGIYRGTVWLFLRFVDKVSGGESRRAVSAQIVEIEAVNLFGVPAGVVRVVGGVGSVVGAVVGFPFFEEIIKFVWGRRKRKKRVD